MTFEKIQKAMCEKYGARFEPLNMNLKLGVSDDFLAGATNPVNGLRHSPETATCGWYLWSGSEFSQEADFFKPLHLHHLLQRRPEILPYLGLPPGWRFLIAPDHEDVWYDQTLLNIQSS
jgi:hypothetical protein